MDITVRAKDWYGAGRRVTAPSSKSFVHRQLIASALSDTPTMLAFRGFSQDIAASAACITALGGGCSLQQAEDGWQRLLVTPCPPGGPPAAAATQVAATAAATTAAAQTKEITLDAGESGSTARFFLPVSAALLTRGIPPANEAADTIASALLSQGGVTSFNDGAPAFQLVGHGRLPQRPMAPLCAALRAHGCDISADCLPLQVRGRLRGGAYALPGNVSSQYITGLLLALPLLQEDSTLTLTTPPVSAGYLEITQRVLAQFGVRVTPRADGWDIPGRQRYASPGALTAEGDWSNAAFWLVADALLRPRGAGDITVEGLAADSVQGDRAVQKAIAAITAPGDTVLDVDPIPDLAPALAVLAAGQKKHTTFANAARLRLKESDRLAAVCALLRDLGGRAGTTADTLTVEGTGALLGGRIDGAGDHRIVMAAAVAAILCPRPVVITGAQAVDKSYPAFFAELGGR